MGEQTTTQVANAVAVAPAAEPSFLQRKCECGNHTIGGVECDSCKRAEQFRTETDSGRRLLAHELAHMLQQPVACSPVLSKLQKTDAGHPSEHSADAVADAVMQGHANLLKQNPGLRIMIEGNVFLPYGTPGKSSAALSQQVFFNGKQSMAINLMIG